MKEKILISWLMICLVIGMASGGTFAYLSDIETSEGNTFTAGTLDLKIKDWDEDEYGDGVTATWNISNMKPGDTVNGWVRLRNDGSIKGNELEIRVINTVIDPLGPESDPEEGTTDMDEKIIIAKMEYYTMTTEAGKIDCLSLLGDNNGNGYKDLDDLEKQGIYLNSSVPTFYPPTSSTIKEINMTVQFDSSAGNDYQGDILNMTMTFTLH